MHFSGDLFSLCYVIICILITEQISVNWFPCCCCCDMNLSVFGSCFAFAIVCDVALDVVTLTDLHQLLCLMYFRHDTHVELFVICHYSFVSCAATVMPYLQLFCYFFLLI